VRGKLLLASLLLSACFNPDDILPVKGTVTSPDPVEGQVVRLLRESRIETDDFTCANATPFKETTADADGRYQLDVFRAQAQKLTGVGQFCFRLESTFASGSSGFTDVPRLFGELELPPLPDWRAQPRFEGEVLRFEPAAPLPELESLEGDQVVHRAEFVTSDGGVAWVADDRALDLFTREPSRVPIALEPWALEDFSGEVRLAARVTTVDPEDPAPIQFPGAGGAVLFELRSGQSVPVAGTRTPLSRGLDCAPYGSPCPLTDGALVAVDGGGETMVTLALPSAVPVSAIVLRGVETPLPLIGVLLEDGDGGTRQVQHVVPTSLWNGGQLLPDPTGGGTGFRFAFPATYSMVHLDGGVVKSFTLVFQQGLDRIAEVSVFE
jgi:hypothetical protein